MNDIPRLAATVYVFLNKCLSKKTEIIRILENRAYLHMVFHQPKHKRI